MTLVSTVLAAALSLSAGPANAHCPHNDIENHRHCDTGGGGTTNPLPEPIIVFEAQGSKNQADRLGVTDLDGNHAIILRSDFFFAATPSWMPNGHDIVFASDWNGVEGMYQLQVADVNGALIPDDPSVFPELIVEANAGSVSYPVVAGLANGDLLLAYSEFIPGSQPENHEIFLARLNPDGTVATDSNDAPIVVNVTNSPDVVEIYPALAPDGLSIAFSTQDSRGFNDIMLAEISFDTDGVPILGLETSLVLDVTDSPLKLANVLEQQILFALDYSNGFDEIVLSFTPENSDRDIWIVPANNPISAFPLMTTPDFAEIRPSWSPDDTQVVYMQNGGPRCAQKKGQRWGLAIRNVNGTDFGDCPAKLVLKFGSDPDWRP